MGGVARAAGEWALPELFQPRFQAPPHVLAVAEVWELLAGAGCRALLRVVEPLG
jgi:hypothetical protein